MKKLSIIFILSFILLTYGCNCKLYNTTSLPQIDLEAEKAALLELDKMTEEIAMEKGMAEMQKIFLAEDAIALVEGQFPTVGKDAIVEATAKSEGDFILKWKPEDAKIATSGDLGFTWGNWVILIPDENEFIPYLYGQYLTVWEKDEDGNWKIAADASCHSPEPKKGKEESWD